MLKVIIPDIWDRAVGTDGEDGSNATAGKERDGL